MKKPSESIPRLTDLISLMERLAPPCLAEEWDNCGLQIGSGDWPVRSIWVALDPLPAVVKAASENNVDLLITHHPLFFHPLKRIDLASSPGRIIEAAVKSHTAIYSAHTNLDSTHEGINDVLARMIGIGETQAMVPVGNDVEIDGHTRNGRLIGLGRIGDLKTPCSALALAAELKTGFDVIEDTLQRSGSGC
ncbi:MAG: Nif3-like dinuclear metal center hexameric protein [Desulfosarcinaceae bacterium]